MFRNAPRPSAHLFTHESAIIAHRGGAHEAPENTRAAFGKAARSGYAIECDVRLSGDGHLIVFHDDTLERTTNGQGRVADTSLKELQTLDAGTGERIPTLAETLTLIDGRVPVIIEVKGREWGLSAFKLARALADVVGAQHNEKSIVAASFNPFILYHVRRLMPEALRALIFSTRSLLALKRWFAQPDILMPAYDLVDEPFVRRMHACEYRILPWTVDDADAGRRLLTQGVDGIITNRPHHMRGALHETHEHRNQGEVR